MHKTLVMLLLGLLASGCASGGMSSAQTRTLKAPAGTQAKAAASVEEGNRFFAASQWEQAKTQYEAAIAAQPTLAEAHYDLALTLEMLGDAKAARKHYIEAANLAPGHKVIWSSPPLRKHDVPGGPFKQKDSFLDAKPQ
ncbi:MAG: tetratricopeptide repeat protein [Nitrospirota bacterium]